MPQEENFLKLGLCKYVCMVAVLEKATQTDIQFLQIPYIWKRRADGLYVINLAKTWEKLMLAARIIVAIENPADGTFVFQHLWIAPQYCSAAFPRGQ